MLLLPKCITEHLSTLNCICHLLAQFSKHIKSCLILFTSSSLAIHLHNLESSANLFNLDTKPSSRSLMYIINKMGPKTEPCGTPLVTPFQSEYSLFIHTL